MRDCSEREVLAVLERLERTGIECWVDRGWGIDAPLGAQTRPHRDLDLVIVLWPGQAFVGLRWPAAHPDDAAAAASRISGALSRQGRRCGAARHRSRTSRPARRKAGP